MHRVSSAGTCFECNRTQISTETSGKWPVNIAISRNIQAFVNHNPTSNLTPAHPNNTYPLSNYHIPSQTVPGWHNPTHQWICHIQKWLVCTRSQIVKNMHSPIVSQSVHNSFWHVGGPTSPTLNGSSNRGSNDWVFGFGLFFHPFTRTVTTRKNRPKNSSTGIGWLPSKTNTMGVPSSRHDPPTPYEHITTHNVPYSTLHHPLTAHT